MEKFFETNRKTILTIAGIGAATALIALVFKNIKTKKVEKETPRPARKESASQSNGLTKEEITALIGSISLEYEGHNLSAKTMQQILEAVRVYATPKYLEIVRDYRSTRRAKSELDRFIKLWYDFNNKLDEVISVSEKRILNEIHVPEALYKDSVEYQKQKQDNELALARVFIQAKLKEELKSTKTISLEELREILKNQIEFTKKEAENRDLIARSLANPGVETAPIIITQILDHIYSKYTVEEEDIKAGLLVHGTDHQVQELSMELQSAVLMLTPDEPSQPEQ